MSIVSHAHTAALIELSAVGSNDTLLTCDPQKSFFHQSYSRITNFAIAESTTFMDNAPSGGNWSEKTATAEFSSSQGDLLGPVYLNFTLTGLINHTFNAPSFFLWTPAVGYAILKNSQVKIGADSYEKCTGEYFMAHDEISRSEGHRASKMIGDYAPYLRSYLPHAPLEIFADPPAVNSPVGPLTPTLAAMASSDSSAIIKGMEFSTRTHSIMAPLPHFWTKHPGNYLNLVGLQYQTLKMQMDLRKYTDLAMKFEYAIDGSLAPQSNISVDEPNGVISGLNVLGVFMYLAPAERRLKAQVSQTVRFTYTQNESFSTTNDNAGRTTDYALHFKNPVSRLLWTWRSQAALDRKEYFQFGSYRGTRSRIVPLGFLGGSSEASSAHEVVPESASFEFTVNNAQRVWQAPEYFLYAQPYDRAHRIPDRMVYSYAFSLHPDCEDEYSGSLNLSRVDNFVFRASMKQRVTDLTPPNVNSVYLDYSNQIGGLNTVQVSLDNSAAQVTEGSTVGTYQVHAETINFYKQSAGMCALLFPE